MRRQSARTTILAALLVAFHLTPAAADGPADDGRVEIEGRLSRLETENAALTERLAHLESLLAHFSRTGDEIVIAGANLRVVNGTGTTDGEPNGLGNVIVGYNEPRTGVGQTNDRSGSHVVVVGSGNNYSGFGGLVVGHLNETSGPWSSVSGGELNQATGPAASVSGGSMNVASGELASVSGGVLNSADGDFAAVCGGEYNQATGRSAAVSGGRNNRASSVASAVSSGFANRDEGPVPTAAAGRRPATNVATASW